MFLTIDDKIKEKEIIEYKGYINFKYNYLENVYGELKKEYEDLFFEEKKDNDNPIMINKSYIYALQKLIAIGESLNANAITNIRIHIKKERTGKLYLNIEGFAYFVK